MDGQWLNRKELLIACARRGAPWTEPQLQRLVRCGVLPYAARIGHGRRGVFGFFPPDAVDRAVLAYTARGRYSYPQLTLHLFALGHKVDTGAVRLHEERIWNDAARRVEALSDADGNVDFDAIDELLRPARRALLPSTGRRGRPNAAARTRRLDHEHTLALLRDALTLIARPGAVLHELMPAAAIPLSPRYWIDVLAAARPPDFEAVRRLLVRVRGVIVTFEPGGPALADLLASPRVLQWALPFLLERDVRGVLHLVYRFLPALREEIA